MKSPAVAAFFAAICATPAMAADLPSGPPPAVAPAVVAPVPFSWTGVYFGVNAGYGFATATGTATLGALSASASESLDGFVGGGQVGANYQFGAMVVGIEADFDGTTQSTTATAGIVTGTDKIPWVGTVRGRLGAAFNRVLVYGTGGLGYGEFESTLTAAGIGTVTASKTNTAWVAGAGVEYAFTDYISGRVEYLYLDTGNIPLATIGAVSVTGRVQDNMVRGGINFKLP